MINKYKPPETSNISVSTSKTVIVSNNFTRTTTTSTTGNYSRTFEHRSSFSGTPSSSYLGPNYRSAFNNQPTATYRSFNTKSAILPKDSELPKKPSKSLLSLLFSSKDKEDSNKVEKKDKKKEEKVKEKDKKKEDKEKEKKSKKNKDGTTEESKQQKPAVFDAKLIPNSPNARNGYAPIFNIQDLEKKLVIKVIKTGKIYGMESDKIPTYLTKSKYSRGKVLLINNIDFPQNKYRAGADVDHNNITKLFRQMGFTVKDHKNKKKKDMEKIVTDYTKDTSLKYADINVTVIMSHGNGDRGNTYIETIDTDVVSIEWIVSQFSSFRCSYLANKPKIFIFQCCRGEAFDTVQTDATPFLTPRDQADVLLAYATVPGYVSIRDPKLGTWYIQAICKIFMDHAHDTDVENLLKIVDRNLAETKSNHRQTSSYENRGFKRCYLNPI